MLGVLGTFLFHPPQRTGRLELQVQTGGLSRMRASFIDHQARLTQSELSGLQSLKRLDSEAGHMAGRER